MEVLLDGQWGTVSDKGWDLSDAAVVCRELGCGDAVEAAYFGPGTGPELMNYVDCFGNEPTLIQCDFERGKPTGLRHQEDAGVICNGECQSNQKYIYLFLTSLCIFFYITLHLSYCSLEFTSTGGGSVEGSHSGVKVVLRIEVKTDPKINPNDPETTSKLLEEVRAVEEQ